MSHIYAFHATARGRLHILNDIPCEDSSASYMEEDGKYSIAIIADGHGSKACFRSDYGSNAAIDVGLECLRQFAETILVSEEGETAFCREIFSNPRFRQTTLRQLTDTIVAGWYNRVMENYRRFPPTAEEMGENAGTYENNKNAAHIYGTTLIAALQLKKCLLLIQQGDGRCEVFYADGRIRQPIPWDERCQDTTTTSLCDVDSAESIRSCIIDLEREPVAACYLGSDGVENAYRDTYDDLGGSHSLMGGVHTFYKDLTCHLVDLEEEEFEEYLYSMLPAFSADGKFSRAGSGDDISVAGIVDLDVIQSFRERFEKEIKQYALDEEIFWKEDELRGKTRKHGILRSRMNEAEEELEKAKNRQREAQEDLNDWMEKYEEVCLRAEREKKELESYREETEQVTGNMETDNVNHLTSALKQFFEDISAGFFSRQEGYQKTLRRVAELERKVKESEDKNREALEYVEAAAKKWEEARMTFDEYDAKTRGIQQDIDRIKEQAESGTV